MAFNQRIKERIEKLPISFQAEVLDFVDYLSVKAEREAVQQERRLWSSLSLSSAMRGMEDEEVPAYTTADLKVVFS